MTGDQWTFLGVALASLLTFYGVLRKARSDERVSNRSASATEVEKMGDRLDKQGERIDALEAKVRSLYRYIDEDHDQHRANGWPINPLPAELA